MAISENTGYPRIGMLSMYSQFLQQLAFKGVPQRFAGVHFSAGKFPVTRVWLALRPAREKKTAVGPGNNRGGYINDAMRMRHGSVKRSTASASDSDAVRAGSHPCARRAMAKTRGNLSMWLRCAVEGAPEGEEEPKMDLKGSSNKSLSPRACFRYRHELSRASSPPIFCFPAQSRANCHATRPLREPRPSAHCSAAVRAGRSSSGTPRWVSHCATMFRY